MRREVVAHPARRLLDVEALLQLRVLGRDADRAAPGVAVVAEAGRGAERGVVLLVERRVAVQRDQRRGADRDRIGAQRQRLGDVGAAADAARDDQLHLAVHVQLLQRLDRLADRRQGRDADVLDEHVLGRAGAALHAVEHDRVGARP